MSGVPSRDAVANVAPQVTDTAAKARDNAERKKAEAEQAKAAAEVAAQKDRENRGGPPAQRSPQPGGAKPERAYPFDTVIVDGREIVATPEQAAALVAAGGRYREPSERMPFGGVRTEAFMDPRLRQAHGFPVAGVPGGRAGSAFIAATAAPTDVPFSRQLETMPMPETDLKKKGSWSFRGGYAETGKPGPREGHGTLSGLEQALSRREWRERRVQEERAREAQTLEDRVRQAQGEYTIRQAQIDPLALARIQAEGRYGGDVMKYRSEAAAREAALSLYAPFVDQILQLTPPERQAEVRMQLAAALANIALGQYVRDVRQDPMAYLMGMMSAAGGAQATAPKT